MLAGLGGSPAEALSDCVVHAARADVASGAEAGAAGSAARVGADLFTGLLHAGGVQVRHSPPCEFCVREVMDFSSNSSPQLSQECDSLAFPADHACVVGATHRSPLLLGENSPSNRIFFKVRHPQMGCKQVGARLLKQTPGTLRRVLAPKVGGAANLACASLALPLAWSAAFSSLSALAGFSGHADYCAANAAVDALALGAAARGLPALSVQWGAWRSVGAHMHAP